MGVGKDVYRGKRQKQNKKSLTFALILKSAVDKC